MKVFLDANILVSVLNKEYPVFAYSSRLLSLSDNHGFDLYTSPLCLAIAYYFAEKKSGNKQAREKVKLLASKLIFTTVDQTTVERVTANPKIHDIEDGLQYYSAIASGCQKIITEDQDDFYFSEIEVISSRHFFEKYVF
jgi:predicted nucleic acid-binding protein